MNDVTRPSLVSTLAATLPNAESKTVGKTVGDVKAEVLLAMKTTTLLKVVAKAFADTQTLLQTEVPLKTEADTLAVLQDYAYINTLNKNEAQALAIRRLTRFHKCRPKALPTHCHATRNRVSDTRKQKCRPRY